MRDYLSPGAIHDAIDEGDTPGVIDVRSAEEYQEGHLPGALHIPVDELGSG